MAVKNNLTIFQRLGQVVNPENIRPTQAQPQANTQRYNIGSDVLLKTDNKADFDRIKLQQQQNKFLANQWSRVDSGLFQQSINYETTRIASYTDFENMEFYPAIAAALDIMMEESTTINDKGKVMNIYSDSKRVKGILEDLFYNRLDIHTSLPMWTRNTVKYGDNFVYLNIDDTHGVVGAKQMPNYEMDRRELDLFSVINGYTEENESSKTDKTKFIWRGRNIEFNSWQMAHFRLLGEDKRLPYGTCLKSDSYIETKNGYKVIQDIVIGDEVYSFDTNTQNRKTSKVLDTIASGTKTCYKLSTKHNYIDVSEEHKVMYYNKESNNFDYKNTLDFKIGDLLVINKEKNEGVETIIDKTKPEENKNGYWGSIDLIPDKVDNELARLIGYLIGDGWIIKSGNAVSIALSEHKTINEKYVNYLNKISGKKIRFTNNNDSNLDFSQAICNSKLLATILKRLGFVGTAYTKRIPSWVFSSSKEIKEEFLMGLIDADGSMFIDEWNCLRYCIELTNELLIKDIKILVQSLGRKSGKICSRIRKDGKVGDRNFKSQKESFYFYFYDSENTQTKKHDINNRQTNNFILEPIVSIEEIGDHETYDIYVEDENHNFYANGIVVHNSVLEKARRIWKQLIMSEDAMLVYRVTRAPERRIYKIYVGNIDDADVPAYVNSIADRFKRAQVMDSQTGQMDLRYNQMPIWKESPIPLLDGRTLSIEELAKEYNEGKENWVYSIQDDTHQVVAGKVTWCGLNYTADEMVKVWLDDDTYIVTAKEHPFILRDGSKKRADELKINDSLMPFYHKLSTKEDGMRIEGYPMVYNPRTGKYKFTHRVVGEDCLQVEKGIVSKNTDWSINNNLTIHHKDFTKTNSNPSNLEWIGNVDHINYHRKRGGEILTRYNKSEKKRLRNIELAKQQNWGARFIPYNNSELHSEHNEIRKQAQLKDWSNPEKKELRSKGMKIKFDSFIWDSIRTNIVNNKIVNRKTLIEFLNTDNIVNHTISINKNDRLKNQRRIERTVVERLLKNKGFNTITEYITENKKNHKVKSLEIIGGDDVYCMTVVGPNGEDDRHNFATLSFKNNGEVSLSGSFLGNSNDQDYFIPVRSEDAPSPIDTLPGATNLDQIADIEYLRNNLFTALRVPKPFLGFDETTGDGKNLALQDIRFSRTINRIQQSMIQELNKIAIIHLYLLGFEEDLDNFTITLNNPSTQADMLRVEQTQSKITLYKDAVSEAGNGFAAMSMTRAKREILGMSDDEIKSDLLEQRMEKAAAAELANSANVIKHTGTFDVVDRVYGDMALALQGGGNGGGEGEEGGATSGGGGGGGLGGSFGGGGTGGEDLDFGDEEPAVDVETPEGGEEIDATADAAAGGEDLNFGDEETPEQVAESVRRIKRILGEQKILLSNKLNKKTERYRGRFVDTLIESIKPKTTYTDEKVKVYDKNVKVNQEIDTMINGIDKMLGE
jgi:intein/homing endonuclease